MKGGKHCGVIPLFVNEKHKFSLKCETMWEQFLKEAYIEVSDRLSQIEIAGPLSASGSKKKSYFSR